MKSNKNIPGKTNRSHSERLDRLKTIERILSENPLNITFKDNSSLKLDKEGILLVEGNMPYKAVKE